MDLKIIKSREGLKGKKGITLVILALMITVLLGIVALAIDVGHLMATRNELQNVADAAALAGAGYLGSEYKEMSYSQQQGYKFDRADIEKIIQEVAKQNKASGTSISIVDDEEDIIIGLWNPDTREVEPTLTTPDAVHVKARRDGKANLAISTFFARIFGIDTMNVSAEATAALTGPAWVAEGELVMPIGLSETMFPKNCTDKIAFSPTTESCAGWHHFFEKKPHFDSRILGFIEVDKECKHCGDNLLNGPSWMTENEFQIKKPEVISLIPKVYAGDKFAFQGGDIASLFNGSYVDPDTYNGNNAEQVLGNPRKDPAPLIALFDYFRYRDGDGNDDIWTTTIPVYKEESGCGNPNQSIEIVGFAQIEVSEINPPPNKTLSVNISCEYSFIEARGGGGTYGNLKGSIPNLVQ